MKKFYIAVSLMLVTIMVVTVSASACTTIFLGGNLTADGAPIVARSEDYTNSRAKMFYISPAGEYKEGQLYIGCREYGAFEWTWTHDSYRFVAFKADNEFDGLCPECGEPGHPSYTESGTNEKGVTVSATESISGNKKVNKIDPLRQDKIDGKVGIEESDIPTVILSEAASAREGVDLLLRIYDEYGSYYGSGLFIADQNEIWYIENTTGTQYIALKLHDDLVFLEPNMAIIGRVDLDDPNIIASERLIEVAKLAGTFIGDEKENIIDFRGSYGSIKPSSKDRLSNGLNFVNKNYNYTEDELALDNTKFTISNLNTAGEIVPLYTNIQLDRKFTPDDVCNYFKVDGIANTGNTDTAFFQLYKDKPLELGTVEWTSMSHGAYNVFIPNYPLLLDETYKAYRSAVGEAKKKLEEKPDSGLFYRISSDVTKDDTYTLLPEGWETSFYWTFDGLSNYILFSELDGGKVSKEDVQYVKDQFAELQKEINTGFDALNETLVGMDVGGKDNAAARDAVTEYSGRMAEKTHKLALDLYNYLTKEKLP